MTLREMVVKSDWKYGRGVKLAREVLLLQSLDYLDYIVSEDKGNSSISILGCAANQSTPSYFFC